MKCSDGILLAVEKPIVSKLLVPGSNRRVFGVDKHVGVAITGVSADGRQLVNRAREEASNYEDTYGHKILPTVLSDRLSLFTHYFTLHGSLRPFGAAALTCAYDEDMKRAELYMVEPSGKVQDISLTIQYSTIINILTPSCVYSPTICPSLSHPSYSLSIVTLTLIHTTRDRQLSKVLRMCSW